MTETPEELLTLADRVLGASPGSRDVRTAAALGRAALESVVADLCAEHAIATGRMTMRVKLICLAAVGDPPVHAAAATAWWLLSRACHQHSYEIEPHFTEVRAALDLVRRLMARPVQAG